MPKLKILKEQYISNNCLVCGTENPLSLRCRFFELEDDTIVGLTVPAEQHQSYPGRLHGGIIASLLDEVVGRAINILEPDTWGATAELTVRYKKPVPYGELLKIRGRIILNRGRLFEGTGEIYLSDGTIAATATAKYMKLPLKSLIPEGEHNLGWRQHPEPPEFDYIEFPDL